MISRYISFSNLYIMKTKTLLMFITLMVTEHIVRLKFSTRPDTIRRLIFICRQISLGPNGRWSVVSTVKIKVKKFLNAKISTTKQWTIKDDTFASFISHDLPIDLVPALSELGPNVAVSRRVSLILCISGTHGVMPESVQKGRRCTISVLLFRFFCWVFVFSVLSTNEADLAWAVASFWHKISNLIQRLSRVVVCVCERKLVLSRLTAWPKREKVESHAIAYLWS